jgi:hypothetical protein
MKAYITYLAAKICYAIFCLCSSMLDRVVLYNTTCSIAQHD